MEPSTTTAPPTAPPTTDLNAPLQIGDTCAITWRDGTTELNAEVIERKEVPSAKRSKLDVSSKVDGADPNVAEGAGAKETAEDYLYYVHYLEHDR